jgi:hypothetical protein
MSLRLTKPANFDVLLGFQGCSLPREPSADWKAIDFHRVSSQMNDELNGKENLIARFEI